jgi:DNA-binding response OmpR family regulator
MVRLLVCRSLRDHAVIDAQDGERALALIRERRPHVAILDWQMPLMSGLEVCRAVRADPALDAVTVIMMTARSDLDSQRAARAAGAAHFIPKPLMPRQLSTLVDRVLASRAR